MQDENVGERKKRFMINRQQLHHFISHHNLPLKKKHLYVEQRDECPVNLL